jgi:hypothetical protein
MKYKILLSSGLLFVSVAHAASNIFSVTPITLAPAIVYANQTGIAYYKVTNNASITLDGVGVYQLPAGVTQNPAGSGLTPVVINGQTERLLTCHKSVDLAAGASCLLKLNITQANMTGNISGGPTVCQSASTSHAYCSRPPSSADALSIIKGGAIPSSAPTISVNTNTLSMRTGVVAPIVVTNNSSTKTINNIRPDFTSTALSGKVELIEPNPDNTALCTTLAPGASCTLSLESFSQLDIASTAFSIKSADAQALTLQGSVTYKAPSGIFTAALRKDQITNADIWASTPEIMSANYAFEGIQGTPNGGTDGQPVIDAGGAWNIITNGTPSANYSAYTPAGDVTTLGNAFGYAPYYGDAMPVCFSGPLLPSSVYPSEFQLVLNTGKIVYPDVASLAPNFYYNERSCVVIFGRFGNRIPVTADGGVFPVTVNIVQGHTPSPNSQPVNLEMVWPDSSATDGVRMASMTGQTIVSHNSYLSGGGPGLLAAKLSIMSQVGQCAPNPFNTVFPNDGASLYGANKAQYRLRVYTSGGFALGNVAPDPSVSMSMMPNEYDRFFKLKVVGADGKVTWIYESGKPYTVSIPGNKTGTITVSGLAALAAKDTPLNDAYVGDNNNYIDIVLYGSLAAVGEITQVDIPASGVNPGTDVPYLPFYNPGGPGNNPTPGVTYSAAGPEVQMPVTNALSDANTVTYNGPGVTPIVCPYT